LHGRRRYKRKKTRAGREEKHGEIEEREPCTLFLIVEIIYIGGEEEESQSSLVIEEMVSHT
jgi:hypothetical protein